MVVASFFAFMAIIVYFHYKTLVSYPPVFVDESWNANAAWNWSRTGVNFDPMHSGTLDQAGYEWLRRPNLGTLPWVSVFTIAGVGLLQARLVSYFFGILLLAAVILVGKRFFRLTTGLLAALFVSLSTPFIISSHYARQDIILAAVVMGLLGLAVWVFDNDRLWPHLILGLCLGLTPDIHQNGILFFPGFFSLYLFHYRQRILRRYEFWLWLAGCLVGLLYFLYIHILPSPQAYLLYLSMNDVMLQNATGMSHSPPILSLNLMELLRSAYNELGRFHFRENSLDFALIFAGAVFIGLRRQKSDPVFMTFLLVTYVSFVLLQGNKVDFYGILTYPLYLLLVAESLVSLISDPESKYLQRIFALCLAAIFIINSFRHYLQPSNGDRNYDYTAVTREITPLLRPDDRILATPTWWLGLTEYDYKSAFMISHNYYFNDLSVLGSMEKIAPTVLIVDDVFLSIFGATELPVKDSVVNNTLSKKELMDFIDCCTEMIHMINTTQYGDLVIYRVVNSPWVR